MINNLSIFMVLAVVTRIICASPSREKKKTSMICGKARFQSLKHANEFHDKKLMMFNIGRCKDDTDYDRILTSYFEHSVCDQLRKNCAQKDPTSHRNYGTNSKCFENWVGSFDDKCKTHLENTTAHFPMSIDVEIIEKHKMCLKRHLERYMMTRNKIRTVLKILEDRIHYANHCYSFV